MTVTDRIRGLYDGGSVDSARQLAREVVRNRSDVSASLSEGDLVVSVPGFTGWHPVSIRADGADGRSDRAVADVGRGTYRLDDGPELDVTVHSLWDEAEAAAVPALYSAVRERGFESLHAVTYATGRSEVRYREGESAESESAVSAESGVLHSVRRLIR